MAVRIISAPADRNARCTSTRVEGEEISRWEDQRGVEWSKVIL